jgi:hypothetical protein
MYTGAKGGPTASREPVLLLDASKCYWMVQWDNGRTEELLVGTEPMHTPLRVGGWVQGGEGVHCGWDMVVSMAVLGDTRARAKRRCCFARLLVRGAKSGTLMHSCEWQSHDVLTHPLHCLYSQVASSADGPQAGRTEEEEGEGEEEDGEEKPPPPVEVLEHYVRMVEPLMLLPTGGLTTTGAWLGLWGAANQTRCWLM